MDSWDSRPEEVYEGSIDSGLNTYIKVNGAERALEVGSDFKESVKDAARAASLGKFRVFLNGSEIRKPSESPSEITEGMKLELRPYDEAGC